MSGANKRMKNIPETSHFIEYIRLRLALDEQQAVRQWGSYFLRACDAGRLTECGQLLRGIKGLGLSKSGQVMVLYYEAFQVAQIGEWEQAKGFYQRTLTFLRQRGDSKQLSNVLNDLGRVHYAQSEWRQAIECYREALEQLSHSHSSREIEPIIRNNLALALVDIGDDVAGASELQLAAQLYQQLGDRRRASHVLVNLGQLYHRQGKVSQALATYQDALQTLQQVGDQRGELEVLNSLGVLYRYQGDLKQAFEHHEQSLALAQELDDLVSQAHVLGNLGTIYHLQNQFESTRLCYEEALALYEMLEDRSGEAQMWGNLGHLNNLEGQYKKSLACYQKAWHITRQINEISGEITALVNLAGAYREREQYQKSEPLYENALFKARKLQNPRLLDRVLGAFGFLHVLQQEWRSAETMLQEALTLQKQRGDLYAQVQTLFKLGTLAHKQGQHNKVLSIVEPAWEIAQTHDYGHWLIKIASLLTDAAFARQDLAAFNYATAALAFAQQYGDKKSFRQVLALTCDPITNVLKQDGYEQAMALCDHLLDLWQQEPWYPWTKPAIDHIKTVMLALREGRPLPKVR